MPKTIEQLAVDYEQCVQRCRDASFYWRVNRELHGPTHWITEGLWQALTNSWQESDRLWRAYNDAYRAERAGSRERHPSSGVRT